MPEAGGAADGFLRGGLVGTVYAGVDAFLHFLLSATPFLQQVFPELVCAFYQLVRPVLALEGRWLLGRSLGLSLGLSLGRPHLPLGRILARFREGRVSL